MKETGKMIRKMERDTNDMLMGKSTLGSTKKERHMERESISGLMEITTKEIGIRDTNMEMVFGRVLKENHM